MTIEEIANSQDYKATKAALEWWYSLPEEQRKATDINAEPDIVDAYSEGVIYGWNNPQWIPVEEELPPPHYEGANSTDFVLVYDGYDVMFGYYDFEQKNWHGEDYKEVMFDITHWMPIVPPQGKEE